MIKTFDFDLKQAFGVSIRVLLCLLLMMQPVMAQQLPAGMAGSEGVEIAPSDDPNVFNEDVFSFRRIRLAPTVVLIGFGITIYSIFKKSK